MKQKLLLPQYMLRFKCVGSECPDTCCGGWQINVDKDTYRKYRNCRHPELKAALTKKVTRNRSNPSDENYAKIKLENNICPFLTTEKLCGIQQELGETYLSNTCAIYPKNVNIVNGVMEMAATISCPEVARLALLNPERMEFDEVWEDGNKRILVKQNINTQTIAIASRPLRYFWELRIFTIGLLQNREYELWERLIILGLFYQKVNEYAEQNMVHEIPALIASYTNMVEQGVYKPYLGEIPTKNDVQLALLKELVEQRVLQGISNSRYLQHFEEFMNGVGYTGEAKKEELAHRYMEVYTSYYQPYMAEHEHILENYLVNYVFKDLFPFKEKSVFDSYVMLVIHYAMIKMHLIGIAGYYKERFCDEHVVSLMWSFSKAIEHNEAYLKRIHDLLVENYFTTMGYMAILIKNG